LLSVLCVLYYDVKCTAVWVMMCKRAKKQVERAF